MKTLKLLLTALTLSFTALTYAQPVQAEAQIEHILQSGDAHVTVNGLVCDFCARALEKVFGKEDSVKAIDVNLDTKVITIHFNEGQTLSDERIKTLITDSGYNMEAIHRDE